MAFPDAQANIPSRSGLVRVAGYRRQRGTANLRDVLDGMRTEGDDMPDLDLDRLDALADAAEYVSESISATMQDIAQRLEKAEAERDGG